MRAQRCLSRRHVLWLATAPGGLAMFARAVPGHAATAMAAQPFPNGVRLLVASTRGERIDRWADTFEPILGRLLPPGTRVFKENAIGDDGITGANQFAVRATPDGSTALLVPGAAATAWLVGDPRVHFDTASWMPVMAGVSPAVVMGRVPSSGLAARATPRIAAAGPTGPELPVLIALDLLGCNAAPVFGLASAEQALAALAAGTVDLVLLHGEDVRQRMQNLGAVGAHAIFAFGRPDASGQWRRDPALSDIPTFEEISLTLLGHLPEGPLARAWHAAAAATMLDFALVLPQLTPTDLVALWRKLGEELADAATVRGLAAAVGLTPESGPAANASTAAVATDATTLLALRSWLDRRFGWRQT